MSEPEAMDDDFTIAAKKWAAERLACNWRDIESVGVATDAGWAGTDVTGGDAATAAVVARMRLPTGGTEEREIMDLIGDGMYASKWFDFGQLLRELTAIEILDADRAEQ